MSAGQAPGAWSPPKEFEEYRLIRLLGRGAMGQVYLAEDRLLARLVAIKFIAAAAPSELARQRFFEEARAVARLSHPNVVAVYRVGEVSQRPFLVSEYVRGQDLSRLKRPVPERKAIAIAIDLARGLSAAHRRGVLHRDVKPANAIITEGGTVKLLDFGLAELLPEREESVEESVRVVPVGDRARVTLSAAHAGAALMSTADLGASTAEGARSIEATASVDDLPPGDKTVVQVTTAPATAVEGAPRISVQRFVGTPLYMAPEIWKGEPASPRSDVYALGVVIYELCAGCMPYGVPPLFTLIMTACDTDAPPLERDAPGVDPRLAAIVARCLSRDPSQRFADGDALREALERLAAPAAAMAAVPEGNPYRGLLAFEAEHRSLFFGRSAEILGILDRLRSDPAVLVAGDSGTGKSSLCRAGVLPAVADGAFGRPVPVVTASLGRHPLLGLSAALAPLLGVDERAVEGRLRAEPAEVAREIRRRQGTALLFVDQLEELCSLTAPDEASAAAEALHALTDRASGVHLLATARSDFLTRLSALAGLGDDILAALYLLRPLTAERLREAVTGPAAAKGYAFESASVVDALVREAQRAEGGLPLLQFALAELWDARDEARRVIPAAALSAIGGVPSALARHADGVLARLPPPHRAAAEAMLLALVTAEGTRARRPEAELLEAAGSSPGARGALEALVKGRLLVAQEEEGGAGSAYSIAHEALLTGWDTLRGWLGHDAEGRALRQRLERAALEWDRLGRAADGLWGGKLLSEAARLEGQRLGAREEAFLSASRRAQKGRRIGRWAVALGLALSIGLGLMGGWVNASLNLRRRVTQAGQALAQARAESGKLDELRKAAFERFDAGDLQPAEKIWADALTQAAAVERAYASVCERLEIVLQQDGGQSDARALLADALYERALLAERDGRANEFEELERQLRVHDPGSTSRWNARARVAIETTPPGAEVTLARFQLKDERWVAYAEATLGKTPVADVGIAPSSVLFTFAAPGRAVVRLPMVLGRGEATRIAIDLPPAAAVPEGFVYVPPGRFLYGSAGKEARALFTSQPLRPVATGAYLIAQNETTFGEWLAFLRSLPVEERRTYTATTSGQGFAVALTELPDGGYQLAVGPEAHPYVARAGEPIRYEGRERRASPDWLRFPVLGVSFEDLRRYAAWLDATGRVPGARPCTDREWERAARGADGRAFPASERLEPDDANFDLTYGRNHLAVGPDEVGSHPASDSPYGVHDLAGNAWEWVSSAESPGTAIAVGGGFSFSTINARGENRAPDVATRRDAFYGFRICATPRSP